MNTKTIFTLVTMAITLTACAFEGSDRGDDDNGGNNKSITTETNEPAAPAPKPVETTTELKPTMLPGGPIGGPRWCPIGTNLCVTRLGAYCVELGSCNFNQ